MALMQRGKVKPTSYPHIPFHFLRTAQLLASLVVSAIMVYFVVNLHHDGYSVPWTFLFLLAVSLATIASLSATIVLHCCCGLNPYINVFLNGTLFVIWTVSFSMLMYWSSGTLLHVCNVDNWKADVGIMVCRLYKALFAFALLGFVATLCAMLLDIYVFRKATSRGKYNQMHDDIKEQPVHMQQFGGPHPQQGPADYGHNDGHYAVQQPKNTQSGYEMPAEQFHYDTGYHGAHDHRMM